LSFTLSIDVTVSGLRRAVRITSRD
jgi:hypothetical protein